MAKYDFSKYEETSGYDAGKHTVRFGKWEFKESKTGSVYLEMRWEKDGYHGKNRRAFTTSRLYFSSERAVGLSKHKLHLICDVVGIEFQKGMLDDSDMVLALGSQLEGKEIEIELVPTGTQNDRGIDYLGVRIVGVGDLFIPAKQDDGTPTWSQVDESIGTDDSDAPF